MEVKPLHLLTKLSEHLTFMSKCQVFSFIFCSLQSPSQGVHHTHHSTTQSNLFQLSSFTSHLPRFLTHALFYTRWHTHTVKHKYSYSNGMNHTQNVPEMCRNSYLFGTYFTEMISVCYCDLLKRRTNNGNNECIEELHVYY